MLPKWNPKKEFERGASKATRWIGSTNSLIIHTIFFAGMLILAFTTKIGFEKVMLVLTTVVSLEAIYLSIFIQMTVNKHSAELEEVSEDIEEIQEDVKDIQEDVQGLDKSKPIMQDIRFK